MLLFTNFTSAAFFNVLDIFRGVSFFTPFLSRTQQHLLDCHFQGEYEYCSPPFVVCHLVSCGTNGLDLN